MSKTSRAAGGGAFDLEETVAVLERTPEVLRRLLDGLPAAWTEASEGEGTWSAYDIVGHLIHGERTDWMSRARRILEHGPALPFEPFDRFAQFEESGGRPLAALLDELEELRRENLAALAALELGERELDLEGTHPELGRVTLRQLLATWAVHDLSHVRQIARVRAKRYAGEVGVWAEYLPVLGERLEGS